jgi:hypothetical protein
LLVEPATLARTLGKTQVEIHAILEDLFQAEICHTVTGKYLEIADHSWPYERAAPPTATRDAWTYTARVKRLIGPVGVNCVGIWVGGDRQESDINHKNSGVD